MAKKKIENESFDAFIKRQYGEGISTKAKNIYIKPRNILTTNLSLDIALSGGIPYGKIVLLSGKPKIGKTYLSLYILNKAISEGGNGIYCNVERRCSPEQVSQVLGDNIDKLQWIESTQECLLSAEDWLKILERAIKDHKKSVIVLDSLAMLSTMVEQSEDLGSNKDMAGPSKLVSSFFRRMQQTIDNNEIVLILISHLISNRDPRGKKWIEKGGVGVQYANSIWLNASWCQLWKPDPDTNEIDGQDIHIKVLSSALGKPYIPCTIPLQYGVGIDDIRDVIIHAENLGLVSKAGAWYSIPKFGEGKFHGVPSLYKFLKENPHKLSELEKDIRQMVLPETQNNGSQNDGQTNSKNKFKKQKTRSKQKV